jgi:phage terminase large subunit-like protein
MASNVVVEMDAAGNVKPSKAKSTERIDGIVASVMAFGLLPEIQTGTSVYAASPLFYAEGEPDDVPMDG